jgi:hypothetical protein
VQAFCHRLAHGIIDSPLSNTPKAWRLRGEVEHIVDDLGQSVE